MKIVNALGDGLRRTGTAIGGTVTYISQKHGSGFEHEEGLSVRIDQFIGMHDAHKKWATDLKAYGEASRKYVAADLLMNEAMSALSLHDFPSDGPNNAKLGRRAAEQKKMSTALEEWNTRFRTIEDGARDLVKEMDDIAERIGEANKQVAELAFIKKKKEKEEYQAEQAAYDQVAKVLLEDILNIMTKKDELLAKWLATWSAIDFHLHEVRGQTLLVRREEEEAHRKAELEKLRVEEEKKSKWREEKHVEQPVPEPAPPVAEEDDTKLRSMSPRSPRRAVPSRPEEKPVAVEQGKLSALPLGATAVPDDSKLRSLTSPRSRPDRPTPLPPKTEVGPVAIPIAKPKPSDETLDEEEEDSDA